MSYTESPVDNFAGAVQHFAVAVVGIGKDRYYDTHISLFDWGTLLLVQSYLGTWP